MPLDNALESAIATLIDLERYPLHAPGSERYRDICDRAFAALDETGAAVLGGFLTPIGIRQMRDEAAAAAPAGFKAVERSTPYFTADEPSLPAEHPRRRFQARSNTMVTYDRIPADAGLRRLYEWDGLTRFVAQACGRSSLHRYADPLAALTINVSKDGDSFAWHFDTNDYSVTLALQMPEMGGAFEYVPDLRGPRDERYEDVQRVLDGDRSRVRILAYRPGDLVLFRGRNALHRVTPTRGARDRLVAILSYTTLAGVVGRPECNRQVYGRALDTQRAAAARPEVLID
jgi:hypothetical protein